MTATISSTATATGRVVRVIGPVVDVEFARDSIPALFNALHVTVAVGGNERTLTLEVAQHLGDNVVRTISMQPTDGMVRGVEVTDTGNPISVPVGEAVKGHVFNTLGECLDEPGYGKDLEHWSIHRKAPPFNELEGRTEMLETGLKVIDLLQERGWTSPPMEGSDVRHAGHHHLPPLFHGASSFRLEIHDQLLPGEHPFRFATESLWSSARRITVNGRAILVPDPMHQLWHTCVHFTWSHAMQWGGWRSVRDTAAIISGGGFDWAEFADLARETRAASCCFWTLRLTRGVTGAAVPDDVLTSLQPPYPEFIIDRLERHFVSSLFPSKDRCPSVLLTRRLWEAGVSPRRSGHGAARPWQVSERWIAASGLPKSRESVSRALGRWARRIGASVAYLFRLSRFTVPIYLVNFRTSA